MALVEEFPAPANLTEEERESRAGALARLEENPEFWMRLSKHYRQYIELSEPDLAIELYRRYDEWYMENGI